jgi:hypothetical protein
VPRGWASIERKADQGACGGPAPGGSGPARLSEQQVAEHAKALIAAGMDAAGFAEALREDGYAVPACVTNPKPRTGELADLLAKAAQALRGR